MPLPLFDIPTFVLQHLVPNYRLPKFITTVQSFLYGLTWRKGVFDTYVSGDAQLPYNPTTTYGIGNGVQYNFATYESLINSNTGNQPDINPDAWILRNSSFIGATERANYSAGDMKLTAQLNRYFQPVLTANGFTGFHQPPWPPDAGGVYSSIYITNAISSFTSLLLRTTPQPLGIVRTIPHGIVLRTVGTPGSITSYKFIVHIPISVYNSLGANDPIRSSIVNKFVQKYAVSGTSWTIQTY